jgi:RES domain-containing protein
MIMRIFRIALSEYCDSSGEGARLYGGRWNLPGRPALYGSGSVASCLLERLTIDSELFSSERYVLYSVMELNVPDRLVVTPSFSELPADWDAIPPHRASQEYGSQMLDSRLLCFGVPSVVDTTSMNYVINPLSEDFSLVTFRVFPLELDKRIVR